MCSKTFFSTSSCQIVEILNSHTADPFNSLSFLIDLVVVLTRADHSPQTIDLVVVLTRADHSPQTIDLVVVLTRADHSPQTPSLFIP